MIKNDQTIINLCSKFEVDVTTTSTKFVFKKIFNLITNGLAEQNSCHYTIVSEESNFNQKL